MSSSDPQQTPAATPPPPQTDEQRPGKPGRRGWWPFHFVLAYTRGLILDQHLRRMTMFYVVIAAMLMAFFGDVWLSDWLDFRDHIARFAVYWLACGWLTVLAALLAVYDLLLLRIHDRLLRRELRARMLEKEERMKDEG